MAHNNATNDFGISLTATLNTSNIPNAINKLNADLQKSSTTKIKLPVEVDDKGNLGKLKLNLSTKELEEQLEKGKIKIKDFYREVNTLKDQVGNTFKDIKILDLAGNLKDEKITQVTSAVQTLSETTRKFVDESGAINTVVRTVDNLGQTVQTQTKTYNEFGQTIKETTKYVEDSNGNLTQVGETYRQVSTVVSETSKSLHKYKDDTGAVVTEINELTKQGENLKTVIKEEVDAQGQITKTTELWNNATNSLISSHQEIINDETKLVQQHNNLQQSIKNNVTQVHSYLDGIGRLVKETTTYNEQNEKIVTTVTEETNALGKLTQTTKVYNETQDKLISTDIQIINNEVERQKLEQQLAQNKEKLTTVTKEEAKVIEVEGEKYKAVVKTIHEQISANEALTTTITTYKNKLGETVVETEKVNQAGEHVAQSTRTVTKELEKESEANKVASNSAKENAKAHDTLGQSLAKALTTLAQYYVASLPIRAFREAVSGAVTTVKEFDSALIEFRKVSDLAGESLTQYVAKLAEMGKATGSTMQAMVEAAT